MTVSCGEGNNNPCSNIPLFEEQQPTEFESDDSSSESAVSKIHARILLLSPDQRRIFDYLLRNGFDEKSAIDISFKHSTQDISSAVDYLAIARNKKRQKGEKLENEQGYFRDILNKRYWEK